MDRPDHYKPAAGYDWLLPFYDPVLRLTMRERTFKTRVIEEAEIRAGAHVLDLGCGTGTMTVMIKRRHPDCSVRGLDGDPKALARARGKAGGMAGVEFDAALSYETPYGDGSFDRVISSLMFHHLQPGEKRRTLIEVARILKRDGSLHIVDFARYNHDLPDLYGETGFTFGESRPHRTLFGTLAIHHARRRPDERHRPGARVPD